MQNAERRGKVTQSQVHAWYLGGTSHVLGRGLGGTSQVHARYLHDTCVEQATPREMQNAECRMQNGGWGLSLAAVPSGQLVALKRRSGGLAEAISLR